MFFHEDDNFSVQKWLAPYDVLGDNTFQISDTYQEITLFEATSQGQTKKVFRCQRCENSKPDVQELV